MMSDNPDGIEFDSTVSRLTPQEKETLIKYYANNKSKKAARIAAGILLSFLTLILLFLLTVILFNKNVITEDNILYFLLSMIVIWVALTAFHFRWIGRISSYTINKLVYKKQVMYISTDYKHVYRAGVQKIMNVWEYGSESLEQITYPVYGNTIFPKGVQPGDLIYKYTSSLDNNWKSVILWVSKTL